MAALIAGRRAGRKEKARPAKSPRSVAFLGPTWGRIGIVQGKDAQRAAARSDDRVQSSINRGHDRIAWTLRRADKVAAEGRQYPARSTLSRHAPEQSRWREDMRWYLTAVIVLILVAMDRSFMDGQITAILIEIIGRPVVHGMRDLLHFLL